MAAKYTAEQLAFIEDNAHLMFKNLAEKFNAAFPECQRSADSIKRKRTGIGCVKRPPPHRFKNGTVTRTAFKPGRIATHRRKQGSIVLDGAKNNLLIKVDTVDKWQPLNRYTWETVTGKKLSNSEFIIHKDGCFYNNEFSNLAKISRRKHGIFNRHLSCITPGIAEIFDAKNTLADVYIALYEKVKAYADVNNKPYNSCLTKLHHQCEQLTGDYYVR